MSLIEQLQSLLVMPRILERVDQIEAILLQIDDDPNNKIILEEAVSLIKGAIQKEALTALYLNDDWGLLAMATGTGKSKIPIDAIPDILTQCLIADEDARILLVVPTEKLRDENWKEEFEKWGAIDIYNNNVERTCYASLNKYAGEVFDLVIGDEFHNITENNSTFFKTNYVKRLHALTATEPSDLTKINIIKSLKLPTVYEVPLDIAVRLRLVSPYEITIVECRLDDITRNVPAGSKEKPFMQTEKKAYDYLSDQVKKAMWLPPRTKNTVMKFRSLNRMRFIKNLESKTKSAIFILQNIIPNDARTLIFCGSIAQAETLCTDSFHSKSSGIDKLELFKKEEVNKLAVVDAVNEGHNIPNIDWLFIVQMDSSEKTITQRLGRGIRYRPGHICKVIILMVMDTVDEKWIEKATINLDKSNIRRVRYSNLFIGNNVL